MLALHFEVLTFPLFDLFPNANLTLGESMVELLILFLQLLIVDLESLDKFNL